MWRDALHGFGSDVTRGLPITNCFGDHFPGDTYGIPCSKTTSGWKRYWDNCSKLGNALLDLKNSAQNKLILQPNLSGKSALASPRSQSVKLLDEAMGISNFLAKALLSTGHYIKSPRMIVVLVVVLMVHKFERTWACSVRYAPMKWQEVVLSRVQKHKDAKLSGNDGRMIGTTW